jgi:PAS domain S-box-containing protein
MRDTMNQSGNIKQPEAKYSRIHLIALGQLFGLSLLLAFTFLVDERHSQNGVKKLAETTAHTYAQKDASYRELFIAGGGAYLTRTDEIFPEAGLALRADRDIETPHGKMITLVSPKNLLHLALERQSDLHGLKVVSTLKTLQPLSQEDSPDDWELQALRALQQGRAAVSTVVGKDGQEVLRYMYPVQATAGCVKNRMGQDLKVGDLLGGFSVTVPMELFASLRQKQNRDSLYLHFTLWILGAAGIVWSFRKIQQRDAKIVAAQEEWEKTFDSMSDIVTIQDKDMRIVRANKAACEMLAPELKDLSGHYCYNLFSGGTQPCPECPEIATLENLESHSAIICHDKLSKIFLVSSSPIFDENNEVQHLVHVAKDITEQKRLEEQQVMFNSLVQQSNDAIYVVDLESTNVLFANRKGYENLGYDNNELVDLTIYDIAYQAESNKDWQKNLAVIREKGFYLFECTQRRQDNSLLPVEINARIIRYNEQDFVVAVVRDISERKSAEEEIYQEKNKLEAVVAALGSGLTFQDRDFKIIYQNKLHKEQHGDHVGELCYAAYHGRRAVCPGCLLAKCFADGKNHHRETTKKTDNGTIHLDISASPFLDASGKIIGGVETVRDITDKKMLEGQVRQSQKMEAMGTLAGGIAHDFNNILAAIMGYCDMALQDTPTDNQVYQMLEHVAKGTERARDLVQQILTFSRKADQQKAPMLLQPIIKEVLKLLRATMPATIVVTSDIAPECGQVLANPTIIHQLIMNLCTNSYHAMRESGGQLSISLSPLTVKRELAESIVDLREGLYVQLTISDNGHGIDQSTLKRVFEPYYTTKMKGEGTGLGLAVVHGIVKGLDGAITVTSAVGDGTTFQVLLPQDMTGEKEEEVVAVTAPMGQGHILLVDDEEEVTAMTSLMLARLGYRVSSFNSSRQALEAFGKSPDDFELIITDQTMPEFTGIDLAQRIMEIRPKMPILLISGYSEKVDTWSCRAMGLSGFQRKPFKDYEIGEAIQEILSRT